ncbi:MAG TPA: response regulator [Salinimicrobium sp.]|nr:response regulator [Salinimicrobium sp.]
MNKILLVEDDHYLGIILKDQLEMNGYEVSLLRIPSETVKNILENKFDLVIMDKLLAGIDGTDISAKIRVTDGISDTPILMMSGFDGAKEVCIEAGANNFIAKPFEVDHFLQCIEATIGEAKNFKMQ